MKTVFAAFTLALLPACSAGTQSNVAKVGSPAPNWTMPLSAGGRLSLASLKGNPVYLNFFATWCGPCNSEAPTINALQKKYAGQGLHVVGVDVAENTKKAQGFREKYALVYPAVVDSGALQSQYSVNGLPVHVFIGRDGVIRRIRVGEMSPADIEGAIRTIL
ncbi:MAG: TlpA family protein disulfide reductase [Candidatus Eremiobacteraeota bacterium]|nr:TlpA family protein disulfide reductase [Candidatus Eremiobacteraeota bacterium]